MRRCQDEAAGMAAAMERMINQIKVITRSYAGSFSGSLSLVIVLYILI